MYVREAPTSQRRHKLHGARTVDEKRRPRSSRPPLSRRIANGTRCHAAGWEWSHQAERHRRRNWYPRPASTPVRALTCTFDANRYTGRAFVTFRRASGQSFWTDFGQMEARNTAIENGEWHFKTRPDLRFQWWSRLGSNQRPSACEMDTTPGDFGITRSDRTHLPQLDQLDQLDRPVGQILATWTLDQHPDRVTPSAVTPRATPEPGPPFDDRDTRVPPLGPCRTASPSPRTTPMRTTTDILSGRRGSRRVETRRRPVNPAWTSQATRTR